MNKVFVGVFILMAALTGCKTKSEQGGRAGNDTFKIVVPATLSSDNYLFPSATIIPPSAP